MIGAPCQSNSLLTRTRTLSSRQIRQRGSLRSKSVLTGSAALVIVLIRKWLQPSGFTQNVHCTHRIVSGQDVTLQSLGDLDGLLIRDLPNGVAISSVTVLPSAAAC